MIRFQSIDLTLPAWFDTHKLVSWIEHIVSGEGKRVGELVFYLVSNSKILEINKQYLQHDYFTDIITFDLSQSPQILRGEIFISLEMVEENALLYNKSVENELNRVIIHGVLHLLGYDDHTEKDRSEMRAKEDVCLSLLA
ncbi:MAG: rRNA maturation RNase YbeY [Bacteroidetes bacterium]|nr:rRNA maturation RNase YbeY [Bacteroidota bacterium]